MAAALNGGCTLSRAVTVGKQPAKYGKLQSHHRHHSCLCGACSVFPIQVHLARSSLWQQHNSTDIYTFVVSVTLLSSLTSLLHIAILFPPLWESIGGDLCTDFLYCISSWKTHSHLDSSLAASLDERQR